MTSTLAGERALAGHEQPYDKEDAMAEVDYGFNRSMQHLESV